MIMIDMCSTEHSAASDAMETLEQHQQEQVGHQIIELGAQPYPRY